MGNVKNKKGVKIYDKNYIQYAAHVHILKNIYDKHDSCGSISTRKNM